MQRLCPPDRKERGAYPANDQPAASIPGDREPENDPEPAAGRPDPVYRQHFFVVRVLCQQKGHRNRFQFPVREFLHQFRPRRDREDLHQPVLQRDQIHL